ncbi:MAG: YdcF family protein [Brevundimonas sp.]
MKRVWKFLFSVIAGGAAVVLIAAALIVVDGLTDDVGHSDVAVVLGSKVNPDGSPSPRLAARLSKARDLHRDGLVTAIIVSGGTGKEGVPEGSAMKLWLVRQGIPEAAILVDDAGVDTMATARNAAVIMRANDFDSAIVVTQYFHISRTRLAFSKNGHPDVGSAHPDYFEMRDLYSIAREIPGYASYLLK